MERIRIEWSPPILVSTFSPGMTLEDYREYLATLTARIRSVDRYISMNVVDRETRMTREQRALQTAWLRENHDLMTARSLGTAFVFPSPVFRFVFSTILAVQRFPVAYHIAGTREEALAWIRTRLEGAGIPTRGVALLR